MNLALAFLMALLAIFPSTPARSCMLARRDRIVAQAQAASTNHGVPLGVLYMVAFRETHVGCDRASGGCWGAPVSPTERHTAGTAEHAARALATSFARCHSWRGAISRFRCGLCTCPPRYSGYVNTVMRYIGVLYDRVGEPLPDHMTPPLVRR